MPAPGAAGPTGTAEGAPPEAGAAPRSAGRALSLSLVTTVASQVLMAASGIVLARALGREDRGALAAAMIWPTVIGGIATLGLAESLTYHIAEQPRRVARWVGSGLALAAIQGAVFMLVTAGVVHLALGGKGHDIPTASLLYSLNLPAFTIGVVFLGTLNGLHRYSFFSVLRLAIFATMFVAQSALLLAGVRSITVLVAALLGCQLVTTALGGVLVRRAGVRGVRADREDMRTLLAYGARSTAGSTSSFLNQRLDQLVMSAFLSPAKLGLYVVAVNLTSVAGLIGNSIAYAALPAVAGLTADDERRLLARRLVGLSLLLSTMLALPVILLAGPLIHLLFGADFLDATGVARLLAVGSISFATSRALEAVLRAVGRPLDASIAEIIALGGTIAGLAVLLPVIGITGAAATSVMAYSIASGWMARRAARTLGVPVRAVVLPDRDGVATLVRRFRGMAGAA